MGEEKKNTPERREFAGMVFLGVCMDEDIDYGPNVIAFGMVASGITRLGTGNQELLPDSKRQLLAKVGKAVRGQLQKLAERSGAVYVVTSHAGCGGGGAQDIRGNEDLTMVTSELCRKDGIQYLGHIPYSELPVEIGNSNITANIGRSEADHYHGARRIILTVGGGITEQELKELESDGYGDGFVVSADVLVRAIEDGEISEEEALSYLELHLDVADGIADGIIRDTSARIYDAGRLSVGDTERNMGLVNKFLARINS